MIEINPTRFRLKPYAHQLRAIKTLLQKPIYALFHEMRLGKTKAVIDAACLLMEAGELDAVVVACPAQVVDVWLDPKIGEITTHCFLPEGEVCRGFRYNARNEELIQDLFFNYPRAFIVTSLEFLRQEDAQAGYPKVKILLDALKGKRFWLVCDEASALGNHQAAQTLAVLRLRAQATRVALLDGTPIGNSPMEQYSKFKVLGDLVLGYKNFFHFRAVHGQQVTIRVPDHRPGKEGKWRKVRKVIGFQKQEVIDRRVKPYCEYLEQKSCLDMPEKVRSVFTVNLTEKTWGHYRRMRDELLAELNRGTLEVQYTHVKILRLAQLCAGFLGGWTNEQTLEAETEELSQETLDGFMAWLKARLLEKPDFKCVVWCRWRAEIKRLSHYLQDCQQSFGLVYGGTQQNADYLNPRSEYEGSFVLVAQPQAARFGVNYSKADTAVYLSQDYNRVTRAQSEDRIQAPGVRKTSLLVDVLVRGPQGQRTIVDDIVRSLREKEEVARRTTEAWKKALEVL